LFQLDFGIVLIVWLFSFHYSNQDYISTQFISFIPTSPPFLSITYQSNIAYVSVVYNTTLFC
jgi:hypothetical protein